MAYIRKKTYQRKGGESTYYYVVQSYRDEGKPKQATIAYLGECPTVESAIRRALRYQLNAAKNLERARAEMVKAEKRPMTFDDVMRHTLEMWSELGYTLRPAFIEQYIHEHWDELHASADKNRKGYERSQRQIEQLTRAITKHTDQLATLRHAAGVLGITDADALALLGSPTYATIEADAQKPPRRVSLPELYFQMRAEQARRSAQKTADEETNLGTTPGV